MAWDKNVLLCGTESAGVVTGTDIRNNNGSYTARTGSWVTWVDQPSNAAIAAMYKPRSGTMLLGSPFKAGLVEFRLWLQGITETSGNPTRTDVDIVIEEADDDSATNVQPVCHFRLGSNAAWTAAPNGFQLSSGATTTTKQQFSAVGSVTKPWLRYNSTVTLTAGASPDVTIENVVIFAKGIGVTLEDMPPNA